jgi:hypothetical protein
VFAEASELRHSRHEFRHRLSQGMSTTQDRDGFVATLKIQLFNEFY